MQNLNERKTPFSQKPEEKNAKKSLTIRRLSDWEKVGQQD
jgi:hypothetical protein